MRTEALTELPEPAFEVGALAAPEPMPIDLVAAHFLPLYNKRPCYAVHITPFVTEEYADSGPVYIKAAAIVPRNG